MGLPADRSHHRSLWKPPTPANEDGCGSETDERQRARLGDLRCVPEAYGGAEGLGEPIAVGVVVREYGPGCHGVGCVHIGMIGRAAFKKIHAEALIELDSSVS